MRAAQEPAGARADAGDALGRIRRELLRAAAWGVAEGVPGTEGQGQLIRPRVALAGVDDPEAPPAGFWEGVLAIQLAHEASLVHDDVLDHAATRRGEPTLAARSGVARALLRGDHLLTAAYRAAARTGSLEFATLFARAVERTVAGEGEQAAGVGARSNAAGYERTVLMKSGELLGCALALGAVLEGRAEVTERFELGRRLGLLYQRLDDLLDYCPRAGTGKPPFADYRQRRWTWVLESDPELPFGEPLEAVSARLHRPGPRGSPLRRALAVFEAEGSALRGAFAEHLPAGGAMEALVEEWVARARAAVTGEEAAHAVPRERSEDAAVVAALHACVPATAGAERYLALHSRSFRFATRFFGREAGERVARVYAYCRVTDDLVDRPPPGVDGAALLDAWMERSRAAYDGARTGLPLLDRVMAEMAGAGVPFAYAEELAAGMRMDLAGRRYRTLADLRRYTYRVASVVGLWLTRLFGVHDPAVLERAARMGHAMQLTNILRDVGEDWRRGRLYLPTALLRAHGVEEEAIEAMVRGAPLLSGYRALVEELMGVAEEDYGAALEAVPALPPAFGRPVAVAAYVYRGIHRDLRRRGHDNLRQRAYTPALAKGALALSALWSLHRRRSGADHRAAAPAYLGGGRG